MLFPVYFNNILLFIYRIFEYLIFGLNDYFFMAIDYEFLLEEI